MFRKPFRIKSQSAMKGSDRKRLRAEFQRQYPLITESQLTLVFGNNEDITVIKISTHAGCDVFVYCVHNNPAFFELDKIIYPTVYFLWRHPDVFPMLTTYPEVFKRLEGGADLMLPGVIIDNNVGLGVFGRDQGCAVTLCGNQAAVAVGRTTMSSEEMIEAGMRGKGIIILHTYRDQLWAVGDKSELPLLATTASQLKTSASADVVDTDTQQLVVESAALNELAISSDAGVENPTEPNIRCCDDVDDTNVASDNMADVESVLETDASVYLDTESAASALESNNTSCEPGLTTDSTDVCSQSKESVDALLFHCFLCALKVSTRKSELPLLTSTFFRNHMVPYCPTGSSLDVKKSSYKKLSKFLAAMQKKGFIEVKELTKGVESIVNIDRDHLELRPFQVPDQPVTSPNADSQCEAADPAFSYTPPTIVQMYQTTAAVLPLMSGKRKGDAMMTQDVRQHITEYVRRKELQDGTNRSMVKLDTLLHDTVVARGDYVETLRWDELVSRCLAKMTAVHCVMFAGCEPQIHRGQLEPIVLDVVQRGSNKKATVIYNLETYGIDPDHFASTIQKGVACSATVGTRPAKPKELQVMVQGNQIHYIGQLLRVKYKLPQKFIRGLEKAPKLPKKKT